jgi:hypothetical protein
MSTLTTFWFFWKVLSLFLSPFVDLESVFLSKIVRKMTEETSELSMSFVVAYQLSRTSMYLGARALGMT